MKKQASTLLPALLDLLRQYLALDMAVYAGQDTPPCCCLRHRCRC